MPAPMLALQLKDGRPQLLLEGEGGPIKLQMDISLHDGHWHSLHLSLDSQVRDTDSQAGMQADKQAD